LDILRYKNDGSEMELGSFQLVGGIPAAGTKILDLVTGYFIVQRFDFSINSDFLLNFLIVKLYFEDVK